MERQLRYRMVTQAEVARNWKTSRAYVWKCIRKGCPLDSLQSARDWRNTYARQRPPTDRKQLRFLYGDEDSVKSNGNGKRSPRTTSLLQECLNRPLSPPDSLESPLESSPQIEKATGILLQQALEDGRESKIVAAFRNYNKAVEGRLKIHQWCHKDAEHRRHLVPMKEARLLIGKAINVLVPRLVALPEKVGSACNPDAPVHAIAVLRDECLSIIEDIERSWPVGIR